jgi:hypothetical protein
MEAPCPLIQCQGPIGEKDTKLALNPDACRILETLDGPLGVISIAGLYRTVLAHLISPSFVHGWPYPMRSERHTKKGWNCIPRNDIWVAKTEDLVIH